MKAKQAILVAIPPLLTVLGLVFAYIRYTSGLEQPRSQESDLGSHFEESWQPPEPGQDLPVADQAVTGGEGTDADQTEALDAETANTVAAEVVPLTLEQAEQRLVELASPLSELPLWQKYLGQSRPLQRFVAALDSVALGNRPLEPLDFLRPENSFSGEKRGQYWCQSAASKERFSDCIQLFCGVSPAAVAKLYRFLEPALQQACANLGYRDKTVRALLTEAVTVLLSTPVLEEEPLLTAGVQAGIYYWQHPELEKLNDAQKLFLRLGNQNAALVRKQLEAIAAELQLYQQ